MKRIFNLHVPIALLMVFVSFSAFSQKKKKNESPVTWRYEIECAGTGTQGTYLIKVWSYSRKPDLNVEQAKKNAVHGVIFKGFGNGPKGCVAQKALSNNPNLDGEHKAAIDDFFKDGGAYLKYVSLTSDGAIAAGDRLKVSKKEYKIGVIVSVNKDELRKYLENKKVIKSLNSGF